MKKLRKIFAFSLSLCLCTTSLLGLSFAEEAAGAVSDTVGQALSALVTDYGATSAQIALWEGGAITQTGKAGVYSKSENRALTEDVLYGIGSISKIYATAAVMKLVDEKKVELDAPLTTYIPEFTMADARYKNITVRMLMNHSSGLHGSSFTNAMLFDDVDPYAHDQLLSQLATQSLKADPGAFSVYCNDGFTLLEILAERVTGKAFTAIVHEFFTQPLSLNETKTPSDDFDRAMLAKIYSPVRQEALPTEVLNVYGAGGIYASARDLASFGGVFTNQSALLSQEAKTAMAQPEYKKGLWPAEGDMGMSYGLGWDSVETFPFNRYGITALSKGGDTQFFHASLVVLPEYGLSAAVVSSGGSSQLNGMVAAKLLLETLKSKGIIDEIKPDAAFAPMEKQEMPPELMANSGLYGASSQTVKLDVAENGTLTLTSVTLPTMPAQTFSYVADGVFCDEAQTLKLSFVTQNGRTYLWTRGYGVVPGLGQVASNYYEFEKIEENPVSEQVMSDWLQRCGKLYFLVNEKYTSQLSFLNLPATALSPLAGAPGYLDGGVRLVDETHAKGYLQIPGINGRDTKDLTIASENGTEYLYLDSQKFIGAESVPAVYDGENAICTILPGGDARWYTVGNAAGKTMTVPSVPGAGAAVYDQNGQCVFNSLWGEGTSVQLPANGYLMFSGTAGARFLIHMQASQAAA